MNDEATPIVLSTFKQADYWVDRKGNRHALRDMSRGYLENVLWFLRDRPEDFYVMAVFEEDTRLFLAGFDPNYDQPVRTLESKTPAEWLEQTPLLQAINTILDGTTEEKDKR
ncbi:hypothetical protein [Arthrobacter sp. UYCo732]|uniref:hypothetical protein n=1 Tax=Arthrobacter sp. UYCo732 TaxID=3156336 RepID=UPI0033917BEE